MIKYAFGELEIYENSLKCISFYITATTKTTTAISASTTTRMTRTTFQKKKKKIDKDNDCNGDNCMNFILLGALLRKKKKNINTQLSFSFYATSLLTKIKATSYSPLSMHKLIENRNIRHGY